MTSISKTVAALAQQYAVGQFHDKAAFLANSFSKIDGVNGDATLETIADLMRAGIISVDDANQLALTHVRERKLHHNH